MNPLRYNLSVWDEETITLVEGALEKVPERLHPAVWYLGGLIADLKGADTKHTPVEVRTSVLGMIDGFVSILNALVQDDYSLVHIFFEERLKVFKLAVSITARDCDDFTQVERFLVKNKKEEVVLDTIVTTLAEYIRCGAPPH